MKGEQDDRPSTIIPVSSPRRRRRVRRARRGRYGLSEQDVEVSIYEWCQGLDGDSVVLREPIRVESPLPSTPMHRRRPLLSRFLDPLTTLRWFVPRKDREKLDLVREDLREDLIDMYRGGERSVLLALAVIWWRSLVNFAPFFWRSVRQLLPFKKLGWERVSE